MRYYCIYLAGKARDRLIDRRVNRSAARAIVARLNQLHPWRLYFVVRRSRG